jgi:DNA processing protein
MFSMNAGHFEECARTPHRYVSPAEVRVLKWSSGGLSGTLYGAGDALLLARPAVAVIGSRSASVEGVTLAGSVARELVALGYVVLSGLATGVDAAAHRSAMAVGGRTIAIIGTPLERVYPPQNAGLQEQVYKEHLLVSPFSPGTATRRWHFPARNRLMARLATATVLVEAAEASGTVHQVREGLALGRQVLVGRRIAETVGWVRELVHAGRVQVWTEPKEFVGMLIH